MTASQARDDLDDHDLVTRRLRALADEYAAVAAVHAYHRGECTRPPTPHKFLTTIRLEPELALSYETNARTLQLGYAPLDGEARYACYERDRVAERVTEKTGMDAGPVEEWSIVPAHRARDDLDSLHVEIVPVEATRLIASERARAHLAAGEVICGP